MLEGLQGCILSEQWIKGKKLIKRNEPLLTN
eukprot:COSAG01_NODE_8470_length_2774_cov_1.635888_1_plen_30_part_10